MPGNSFGILFKVTTLGESHGTAIGAGVEAMVKIALADHFLRWKANS